MPTNLSPKSQTSTVILTSTGSAAKVAAAVPFGVYTGSVDFLTGAALQVDYVYKKLGGDVVDIELTPANVYAAYEEAVLEYSLIRSEPPRARLTITESLIAAPLAVI